MSLISNCRGTGTLPHVIINGQKVLRSTLAGAAAVAAKRTVTHAAWEKTLLRNNSAQGRDLTTLASQIDLNNEARQHRRQIRKLRSSRVAKPTVSAFQPAAAMGAVEGLTAAKLLTSEQAPAKVFSGPSLQKMASRYGPNPRAQDLVKRNIWKHSQMQTTVDLRDDEVRSPTGAPIRRGVIYDDAETAASAKKVHVQIYTEIFGNCTRALDELERITDMCPRMTSLEVEVLGENNLVVAQRIERDLLQKERMWGAEGLVVTLSSSLYED